MVNFQTAIKNRTHSLKNKLRKKQTATSEIYDEMMYNFIQYFRNNYILKQVTQCWSFPLCFQCNV